MRTGIITGSNRGIGKATTEALLTSNKFRIIGTSTSGESSLVHPNYQCLPLDLSNSDSIRKFIKQLSNFSIDFLINNAAVLLDQTETTTLKRSLLEATFKVNLFGTVELTEKVVSLIHSGGHIINLTSDWGSFSEPNFDAYNPHYKLSKAALNMYTKVLAERLKEGGITVSSFDPGWTQTDMGGIGATRTPSEVAQDILNLLNREVPSGRFWHRGKERPW